MVHVMVFEELRFFLGSYTAGSVIQLPVELVGTLVPLAALQMEVETVD